ncbi:Hypothetical predicted protein [Paramuricea clavata]|uniref:Uncharacterized protein n=1 Tax=Paramuricea clavata TaxID=317549 RepID=A0A6S7HI57_PARCT|nr:Hypothetical predicted protein [Paramuricea clavata]
MADKPEQTHVPVTSEKKKDPRRVAAGKRLAAISKIAKEKKRKIGESSEPQTDNNTLTYLGLAITFITLVITFRMNRREEEALEPKYTPQSLSIEKQPHRSTMDNIE